MLNRTTLYIQASLTCMLKYKLTELLVPTRLRNQPLSMKEPACFVFTVSLVIFMGLNFMEFVTFVWQ